MVAPARAPLRADRLRAVNEPQLVTVRFDESGVMTIGLPAPSEARGPDCLPRAKRGDRTVGRVEAILESWRIDDEWWRHMIARAYLEVILEGGKRLVLFQDLITGQWFLQMP